VHRVAGICGIRYVFADLEGAVGQVGREAGIKDILREAGTGRPGGVGLRQRGVSAGRSRLDVVAHLVATDQLLCLIEMRTRSAVGIDDVFAQEIVDLLAGLRHVGAEQIIEGVIFADDDDDMLDRGRRRLGECWRHHWQREERGRRKAERSQKPLRFHLYSPVKFGKKSVLVAAAQRC
jgi:hypothetical protein